MARSAPSSSRSSGPTAAAAGVDQRAPDLVGHRRRAKRADQRRDGSRVGDAAQRAGGVTGRFVRRPSLHERGQEWHGRRGARPAHRVQGRHLQIGRIRRGHAQERRHDARIPQRAQRAQRGDADQPVGVIQSLEQQRRGSRRRAGIEARGARDQTHGPHADLPIQIVETPEDDRKRGRRTARYGRVEPPQRVERLRARLRVGVARRLFEGPPHCLDRLRTTGRRAPACGRRAWTTARSTRSAPLAAPQGRRRAPGRARPAAALAAAPPTSAAAAKARLLRRRSARRIARLRRRARSPAGPPGRARQRRSRPARPSREPRRSRPPRAPAPGPRGQSSGEYSVVAAAVWIVYTSDP